MVRGGVRQEEVCECLPSSCECTQREEGAAERAKRTCERPAKCALCLSFPLHSDYFDRIMLGRRGLKCVHIIPLDSKGGHDLRVLIRELRLFVCVSFILSLLVFRRGKK